jgi:hypothetical protein
MWNSAWIPQKGGDDVDELVGYDVLSDLGHHTTSLTRKTALSCRLPRTDELCCVLFL